MQKYGAVQVCLLTVVSIVFAAVSSAAWSQPSPISCCEDINLTVPHPAHGYLGRVNLDRNNLGVTFQVLMPTFPEEVCPEPELYPIPLLATDLAGFTAAFPNHEALVINANFFTWRGNPHTAGCGGSIGLARSDGENLSWPGGLVHNLLPDTLLLLHAGGGVFVQQPITMSDLPPSSAIDAAVSGIMIVQNSTRVCGLTQACERWDPFSRWDRIPRTAVGLTRNRQSLVIVVFEDDRPRNGRPGTSPGVTIDELADYFVTHRPEVTDAMMLDGSGSSALIYHPPASRGVPAIETTPHDIEPVTGTRQHRPVPINLAFVVRQSTKTRIQQVFRGSPVPSGAEIVVPDGIDTLEGDFALGANSRVSVSVDRAVAGSRATIVPHSMITMGPGARFFIGSSSGMQPNQNGEKR